MNFIVIVGLLYKTTRHKVSINMVFDIIFTTIDHKRTLNVEGQKYELF